MMSVTGSNPALAKDLREAQKEDPFSPCLSHRYDGYEGWASERRATESVP